MHFNFNTKNLLYGNKNVVTVHNKSSKIPPPTSMHFATRVRTSSVVRLNWSSHVFLLAAASEIRPSNSSGLSTFLVWTLLVTGLDLAIQTAPSQLPFRIRHIFVWTLLFVTVTDTVTSQILTFSLESPCISCRGWYTEQCLHKNRTHKHILKQEMQRINIFWSRRCSDKTYWGRQLVRIYCDRRSRHYLITNINNQRDAA